MNVAQLIEHLKQQPAEAEVVVFDIDYGFDCGAFFPAATILLPEKGKAGLLELRFDEDAEPVE